MDKLSQLYNRAVVLLYQQATALPTFSVAFTR